MSNKDTLNIIKNNSEASMEFLNNEYVQSKITSNINLNEIEKDELIPQMTSNIAPSGTASCSSCYGSNWDAWIAFNNRTSGDGWYPISTPSWIEYEFKNVNIIQEFSVFVSTEFGNTAKFQYSKDGINWVDATEYTSYEGGKETKVSLNKRINTKYIRLYLTTGVRLYKFQCYGTEINKIFDEYMKQDLNSENSCEKLIELSEIPKITFDDIKNNTDLISKISTTDNCIEYILSNSELLNLYKTNSNCFTYFIKSNLIQSKIQNKLKGNKTNLIPPMTSNTTPSGEASCSSYYGDRFDAYIAFISTPGGDGWYPTVTPAWIQYKFDDFKEVSTFNIYASNEFSNNAKLQYSLDGENWIDATQYKNYAGGSEITKNLDKMIIGKYFRMSFTTNTRLYSFKIQGESIDFNTIFQ